VPVVVGFGAHDGRAIGRRRAALVDALVRAGCAVALVDLRGCGPSLAEAHRGRHGRIQAVAVSEWMLGDSLVRHRLRDLSRILDGLTANPAIDPRRIVLWGESIAPARRPDESDEARFDAGPFPEIGEPAGGLLALAAGALDRRVRAVVARGTLARLASVLDSPCCFVPMDWVVPGLLEVCEVDDLAAAVAPRPVFLDGLIDGRNRRATEADLASGFERARRVFAEASRAGDFVVTADRRPDSEVARWIVDRGLA
jgi:pimeloyl-ACP methyl ester carboxylesterase